jgi:hypothetical protein
METLETFVDEEIAAQSVMDEAAPRPEAQALSLAQRLRRLIIGGIVGLLAVLTLRLGVLLLLPPVLPPAPAPSSATPAPSAAVWQPAAPAQSPPALPPPTLATRPPATLTPLADGCPDAAIVPDGARVGWLARAQGCAGVLYASVDGAHMWVRRPADLSDQLVQQLPELPTQ